MDIGTRIKERRELLGMSQEELAIKVGYKSRSSINKIEGDGRGLPQSKIVAFAKALETTPAYLMGWELSDEEIGNTFYDNMNKPIASATITLYNIHCETEDEAELITSYRELSDIGRQKVISYTNKLADIEKEEYELNAAHARTDIEIPEDIDTSENDVMNDENF